MTKMLNLLENINQQIEELGLPQDQMNSPMPMDNPILPQQVPVSEYDSHPDHEVQMARSDLYRAAKSALSLEKMLKNINEEQGLEGWVQAKITKAADYLDSVYHYLNYEMQNPSEGVSEASVAAYGPGDDPQNPQGDTPDGQPAQQGQASTTPENGGATPTQTSDGMVKMVKIGLDRKPLGTPIMVRNTDIKIKQQQGYTVIGESKEEKSKAKVVHCSQCGKGFSGGGLKAPHQTGFSHCKDHKGMKIVAEATDPRDSRPETWRPNNTGYAWDRLSTRMTSDPKDSKARKAGKQSGLKSSIKDALGKHGPKGKLPEDASGGASSAGGMAGSMGGGNGFANGGPGSIMRRKPRKKKANESLAEGSDGYGPHARGVADGYYGRAPNPHKMVDNGNGGRSAVKLTDPAEIAEYMAGYKDDSFGRKEYGESKETGSKFTGYWKGKDKKTPGKKMVGDA